MKKTVFATLALGLGLAFAPIANATLIITASDGTNSTSNSGNDNSVLLAGTFGGFNFNATGSNLFFPQANQDTSTASVAYTGSGPATLTITLTDTNYFIGVSPLYNPNAQAIMQLSDHYNNGATINFSAYYDNANASSLTNLIGTLGPITTASTNISSTNLVNVTDPFSLTEVITFAFAGGGPTTGSSSIDASVTVNPVPEPGTMMLLGAGFLGLAVYGKRRKNA